MKSPTWVLDSSAVINFKNVPIDHQWTLGDILLDFVGRGKLVFPSEVHRELTDSEIIKHPDMPGAWAARAWRLMKPKPSTDERTVQEVLGAHPDLTDVDAPRDQADLHVVALAIKLARAGNAVQVVADEKETRALQMACKTFGVDVEGSAAFIQLFIPRA